MKAIITVVGPDRVGIIAEVCTLLAELHISVVEISQTIMEGTFTMIMLTQWTAGAPEFDVVQSRIAAKGDEKGVMLMNWLPSAVMMLVFKVIVALVILMAGVPLMETFLAAVEGTNVINAFSVVGGLLPALGIGLNLRAILKMDTLPFLLIGFLLVAYFNLSIVGVALFGLAFAAVYLIYNNKEEDVGYDG